MKRKTVDIKNTWLPETDGPSVITGKDIKAALDSSRDGVIVFDLKGRVLLLNSIAAAIFKHSEKKMIGKHMADVINEAYPGSPMTLKRTSYFFKKTISGIPQHFQWVTREELRPEQALHVLLNRIEMDGKVAIAARLIDITDAKLLEWFLLSLAEVSNQRNLHTIIDDLTQLAARIFNSEHAMVCLLRQSDEVQTISYYRNKQKQKNIAYPLPGSPCEQVRFEKKLCFYEADVQKLFPKDTMLQRYNLQSYIGSPLKNAQREVIGLIVLLGEKKITMSTNQKTIFRLLRERINIKVEHLLSQRKLQFLASISQQDPNPVFRIQPGMGVIYSNKPGHELLENWHLEKTLIPKELAQACEHAKVTNKVQRVEIEVDKKIYLFRVIWVEDFEQVNVYATDITTLKRTQQKMRNLANHDSLTNVSNRLYFDYTLKKMLENSHKNKAEIGLLLIDIDNFKDVNDSYGHPVGDKLLKHIARRMQRCLRQDDFIARVGGDEFAVLIQLNARSDLESVAEKINQTIANPFELDGHRIETACSVGITCFPGGGSNACELMRNADNAMYVAKENGKNQYEFYNSKKGHLVSSRLMLLKKDILHAVEKNQFYIDYQPQLDLEKNTIFGYEAFIRWRHPVKGLVSPAEFIPIAEKTGVIQALGQWSIEQVIKDFSQNIKHDDACKISINVALAQLNDHQFIDCLCEELVKAKLKQGDVILDIAEQISKETQQHLDPTLNLLNQQGIHLSLDNFDATYANLNRLFMVPFEYLKIDSRLIHSLDKNPRQKAFIRGLIQFANQMGIAAIQKGVENTWQNELIKQLGCRYAQGNYYCRPLPIDTLKLFITQFHPA